MLKLLTITTLVLSLSSCISYQSDGHPAFSQISEVRKGHTTSNWLTSNIGTPISKHETDTGAEIWHYQFDEREKTRVSLLLIFSVRTENSTSRDNFEVSDGIVEDYWQD